MDKPEHMTFSFNRGNYDALQQLMDDPRLSAERKKQILEQYLSGRGDFTIMPYNLRGEEINPYQPSYSPYDLSPEEEQLLQWALSRDVPPDSLMQPGAAFDPNTAHDQYLPAEYAMSRGANARDMYSRALESKTLSEQQYAEDQKRQQALEDEQRQLEQAKAAQTRA